MFNFAYPLTEEAKEKLLEKINIFSTKIHFSIAGGGAAFIAEFSLPEKCSQRLVGANFIYGIEEFHDFIGGKPREKMVSDSSARQLAMASYKRACKTEILDPVGIGITCSTSKQDQREGRKNHGFLAIQTKQMTFSYEFELHGDRASQNLQISNNIWGFLHYVFNTDVVDELAYPMHGYESILNINKKIPSKQDGFLFPGSFNPFHNGHKHIVETAKAIFKEEPLLEISIENFSKQDLDYKEIQQRVQAIESKYRVAVTRTPLFLDKIKAFPNIKNFVIGYDTWERISEEDRKRLAGKSFLVFPRNGKRISEEDIKKYKCLHAASIILIENNISSSEIRNQSPYV